MFYPVRLPDTTEFSFVCTEKITSDNSEVAFFNRIPVAGGVLSLHFIREPDSAGVMLLVLIVVKKMCLMMYGVGILY